MNSMATVQERPRNPGVLYKSGASRSHVAAFRTGDGAGASGVVRNPPDRTQEMRSRLQPVGALTVAIDESGAHSGTIPQGVAADDYVMVCRVDADGCADPVMEGVYPVSTFLAARSSKESAMLLFFPRQAFRGLESRIEAIGRSAEGFKPSSLLSSYLGSLRRHLHAMTGSDAADVEAVTIQLVRACLIRAGEGGSFAACANNSRLESARQFIDERLTSPYLNVESVRSFLGISRRQLYLLFEPYGGVAKYILGRRLHKSREALRSGAHDASSARIAEQCGLDPLRFERLFKQEFGVAPAQIIRRGTNAAPSQPAGAVR